MILFYAILLWQVVLGNTVIDRNQNMKDINFIPFKMVVEYIRKYQEGDISIYLVVLNLLGNIVLLAPVGFYLGICTKKRRWLFSLVIGGFCSLVIEILQMLLGRGRFDVDDIILNVVGVGVMYGFAKLSIIRKIMTKFEIRY